MKQNVKYRNVPTKEVVEGIAHIRKFYEDVSLLELAQSIDEVGALYPILVEQKSDHRFELIIGSRRLRAARMRGASHISAMVVSDIGTREKFEMALTENLQREDLTPFEEAWAFTKLMKECGVSVETTAKRIGRSTQYITRRLQLLSLPSDVQELLARRKLRMAHISVLTGLVDVKEQRRFANAVVEHQLSEQDLRTLIAEEQEQEEAEQADETAEVEPAPTSKRQGRRRAVKGVRTHNLRAIRTRGGRPKKVRTADIEQVRLKVVAFRKWFTSLLPQIQEYSVTKRRLILEEFDRMEEDVADWRKTLPR